MEMEELAVDYDWDDDVEESLIDDDFDAEVEFETEFTLGRGTLIALGFRPEAVY